MLFLCLTRRTETLLMEKREVRETSRGWVWDIPARKTKTNQELLLPLTAYSRRVVDLASALSVDSPFVFASPTGTRRCTNTGAPLTRLKKRTGVIFSPHDIRHTIATILGELEIPAYVGDALMNHRLGTDTRMTSWYKRGREWELYKEKRAAIEKWHQHLNRRILGDKLMEYIQRGLTAKRAFEERIMAGVRTRQVEPFAGRPRTLQRQLLCWGRRGRRARQSQTSDPLRRMRIPTPRAAKR